MEKKNAIAYLFFLLSFALLLTTGCIPRSGSSWSFTSRDGKWRTAELIETNRGDALRSQVAKDSSGNAIAVWQQWDGTHWSIWANRCVVGRGWGTAELIETDNAGDARYPQVGMDARGNAMAVWSQSDGTRDNIWANRYVVGRGWATAELIETDNAGDARYPQVGMDARGNAMAVWSQCKPDFTQYGIWANRYVVGRGWGQAEIIYTSPCHTCFTTGPQVAMDARGNAMAVWDQWDRDQWGGTHSNSWANRYVVGTGWGRAELIDTYRWATAYAQVAMDARGNAMAVWSQCKPDFTQCGIWANRYVVGRGWGQAEIISTSPSTGGPQVAMDARGNAMAVWSQSDGTRDNIWANRYVVGRGWATAELIETDNAGDARHPRVAMDARGNAMAVWQQWDGTHLNIWANRYVVGTGWGQAQLIETDKGNALVPQVAMDARGNAMAVWQQWDGTHWSIRANRFN